jgi:hypothetical protein
MSTTSSDSSQRGRGDHLEPWSRHDELSRQVSPAIGAGAAPELGKVITGRSVGTTGTTDPAFEVDYEEDGSDDPRQWKMTYKAMIIFFVSYSTMIVLVPISHPCLWTQESHVQSYIGLTPDTE